MKTFHVSQQKSHEIYGGPKRWIRCFIHETPAEFRERAEWDDLDTVGLWHPAPDRYKYTRKSEILVSDKHYAGVVRFTRGYLTPYYVAHEMSHVAMTIARRDVKNGGVFDGDNMESEEHFCYILGDLMETITTKLIEIGEWK